MVFILDKSHSDGRGDVMVSNKCNVKAMKVGFCIVGCITLDT